MRRRRERSRTNGLQFPSKADWALVAALLLFADMRALAKDSPSTETSSAFVGDNTRNRRIVISIPDRKLAMVEGDRVLKVYPVAVGALSSPTPTGEMRIINKVTAPTYYHQGQIIKPGKLNPLGSRWLGLSQRGYGIHGTNVPSSIGKAASHGCIRMRKQDVEELFELVRVNDVVEIRTERHARWAQIFASTKTTVHSAPAPRIPVAQLGPVAVAAMTGQI